MSNEKTRYEIAFSNWEINAKSLYDSKHKTGFPEEANGKVLFLKTI